MMVDDSTLLDHQTARATITSLEESPLPARPVTVNAVRIRRVIFDHRPSPPNADVHGPTLFYSVATASFWMPRPNRKAIKANTFLP